MARRTVTWLAAVSALSIPLSCGDSASTMGDGAVGDGGDDAALPLTDVVETRPGGAPLPGQDECVVTTARHLSDSRDHFPPCTAIDYPTHPPASGDHFDRWADFKTYAEPVPTGFLVHAMEHGAVVFNYDCPTGCPEVIAAFDAVIAAHGVDPSCDGVDARFIVSPDPTLDAPIAVTAWEHVYLATCIDEDSLTRFVEENYGRGPEDLCARGFDGEARVWCE